jgi:hypothetical protein
MAAAKPTSASRSSRAMSPSQVGVATGLLGEGAAISLFMLPVLFIVVWVQLRYLRRLEA